MAAIELLRKKNAVPSSMSSKRRLLTVECQLAERGGFEPPVQLPRHNISNVAQSATLPPLRRTIHNGSDRHSQVPFVNFRRILAKNFAFATTFARSSELPTQRGPRSPDCMSPNRVTGWRFKAGFQPGKPTVQ